MSSDVQLPGTALQLTTGRILLYCLITKKSVQTFFATDLIAANTFVLSINVVCMKHLVSKIEAATIGSIGKQDMILTKPDVVK